MFKKEDYSREGQIVFIATVAPFKKSEISSKLVDIKLE